nr:septal ring lytic transglycosylase RlpA family protein [uncultured Gellertiella sp.]
MIEKGLSVLHKFQLNFAFSALLAATLTLPLPALAGNAGCGGASWYAAGSRTASGERMNSATLTAAHRSLRFGTKVKVTNRRNGKSVIVRINDRGPFVRGRVLDVSRAAARNLGMISSGTAKVCYETIG